MRKRKILTAESVTEGHPDKVCDQIADTVLDACLEEDPNARVACEVMATGGKIIVAGEITCKNLPDIPHIVCRTIRDIGYDNLYYEVEIILHDQSEDISGAVGGCLANGTLGAGDQGIMYGYACDETKEFLPLPVVLAHKLTKLLADARKKGIIQGLLPDGKAQVSIEYEGRVPRRAVSIVVSAQHEDDVDMDELRSDIMKHVVIPALGNLPFDESDVMINPSGRFVLGGFEADTGLTGRKLMVDTYGGLVPHGGGALSGKDATKVDRSGAYMARYIAKNILAARLAEECTVSIAYVIGKTVPAAVQVDTHGTSSYENEVVRQAVLKVFDLTPGGIIRKLGLNRPIFSKTACYGHFTEPSLPWEQTDQADALREALHEKERRL